MQREQNNRSGGSTTEQKPQNQQTGQTSGKQSGATGNRYAEDAPDSTRKFGEAGGKGSQGQNEISRQSNPSEGSKHGSDTGTGKSGQSPRQPSPARGSGVPTEGMDEDAPNLESPKKGVNEQSGKIESGKRSSSGSSTSEE